MSSFCSVVSFLTKYEPVDMRVITTRKTAKPNFEKTNSADQQYNQEDPQVYPTLHITVSTIELVRFTQAPQHFGCVRNHLTMTMLTSN